MGLTSAVTRRGHGIFLVRFILTYERDLVKFANRRFRTRLAAGGLLVALALCCGLSPQVQYALDLEEYPLLPDAVSNQDIEMRARYVRQWREDDGTLVLMFTGGFQLEMGRRKLAANDAVVWINPQRTADGRKCYELTVYLSESAEIQEVAGTIIGDSALLVSNLKTAGKIIKRHDAHSPEVMLESDLYQRALAARRQAAERTTYPEEPERPGIQVTRPGAAERPPRTETSIYYSLANVEAATTSDGDTVQVATGGVYFSRSGGPDAPTLEIIADNAVVFPAENVIESLLRLGAPAQATEEISEEQEPASGSAPPVDGPPRPPPEPGESPAGRALNLTGKIRAVYLEGDVMLSLGERFIRASRLYYDFERDQALILDAVFRAELPERGIPLYVRADEIRQLSRKEFSARNARVSTSEFHTPHYHVGVEKIVIRDATPRNAAGAPAGDVRGTYELRNATLKVGNVPVGWWPFSRGDYQTSETLLRRFRSGYSDNNGVEIETSWYLFNLLGIPKPQGFDSTFRMDYYSRRGPGVGINADYEKETYFGFAKTYFLQDDGEDNFGPLRDNTPDTNQRGRVLWRHRHYLPNDWELTSEIAYVSDPGFLEEFEKAEWFEGKEQETALYLKRARGTEAVSVLANWRLLDFVTQTEHLPDLTYRRIGDTWLDPLVLYHESRIGAVRYRPDDRHFLDKYRFNNLGGTDVTLRGDVREEAEFPIKLPGLNIVPFATGRGSYWDGQPLDDGALGRGLGVFGLRGGSYLARVYDGVHSDLFDIQRIRHIVQPHFVAWWSAANVRSEKITPFDEGIETVDDFYGFAAGVRQTWQTKRGYGENVRTVDLLTFNLETGFFGDRQNEPSNGYANPIRPEDSRTRNYIAGDLIYRLSDTTSFLYDFNLDVNEWSFDRHNVSLAVERLPRLAYILGWRHAGDVDLDYIGGGFNYRLNEKHTAAFRMWHDLDRGRISEINVTYIRKLPRWYFAVNFELDNTFDDFTVSISMWPEGIPEWTLGSRRFSGLGASTGIKP